MKNQAELFADLQLVGVRRIKHDDIREMSVMLSFESTSSDTLSIQVSIPEDVYDEYEFTTYNGERLVIEDVEEDSDED